MRIAKFIPSTRISYPLCVVLSLVCIGLICASIVYQDGDEIDINMILLGILFLSVSPVFLSFIILGFGCIIDIKFSLSESLRYAAIIQCVFMIGLLFILGYEYSKYSSNLKEVKEILDNTEVWRSEDERSGVAFHKSDPTLTELDVREFLAGVMRSATKDTLLLYPEGFEKILFEGLPAFEITGISYANGSQRDYRIVIVFGAKNTYMIHVFNDKDSPLPDPIKHFRIEDEPAPEAHEGMDFFLTKPDEEINEIKDRFRKLIEAEIGVSLNH